MAYTHTQSGRWHYLLHAFTLATLAGAWLAYFKKRTQAVSSVAC